MNLSGSYAKRLETVVSSLDLYDKLVETKKIKQFSDKIMNEYLDC